jgi:spore germination protein GerM
MKMRQKFFILSVALAALIIAGIFIFFSGESGQRPTEESVTPTSPAMVGQSYTKTLVHLYFADKDNDYLIAEQRVLQHSGDPLAFGRVLMEALIEGPQKGLMRTLPEATKIRAIFMLTDETVCVDLDEVISDQHPGGSQTELLTIYSIVNTLVLNLPDIDQVKLLVGGREATTLAGHIDLQFPFSANMLLIR